MKDDDQFRSALDQSRVAAKIVCDWLCNKGYEIEQLSQDTTPSREDRWSFVDDGDLEMITRKRIEVKHWPDIDFQSLSSVPYSEIIVDEKYKVEKNHARPLLAYITVNKSMTAVIFILAKTQDKWVIKNLYDRAEGDYRDFYLCPKRFCKFAKIQEKINAKSI